MTSPALRYRTGRFANSVRVDNVTQGPRGGNTMIETTYKKTLMKHLSQDVKSIHLKETLKD